MSSFTPQNAAVWFEIPVKDLNKAKTFYEHITKAELQLDESGPSAMVVFPVEDMQQGVSGHLYQSEATLKGGNTVHLAVPGKLEEALVRVSESGGEVVSDIFKIPAGRFAYCQDLDGNSIGVFSPA